MTLSGAESQAWLSSGKAAVAFLFVFGACMAVKLLFNPSFFYHDDFQHAFMPVFYSIGHALRAGTWPMELAGSWFGGDLLVEYQYAIFNPVSLALCYLLPDVDSLTIAATLIALTHYLILCVGCYLFARTLVSAEYALVAVALIATNPYLAYWYASAWIPGLVSLAWLPWLLWGMSTARLSDGFRATVIFIACFSIATAGWPHSLIATALVILTHSFWQLDSLDGALRYARVVALPALGAALAAAPSWLPIVLSGDSVGRPKVISNEDNFLVTPLGGLANLGFPNHLEFMNAFNGSELTTTPLFYAAPGLLALVVLVDKHTWHEFMKHKAIGPAIVLIGLFLLLSLGPANLGPLRWPFRHTLYAFLLIALVLPVFLSVGIRVSGQRVKVGIALCLLSFLLAWQKSPHQWVAHARFLVIVLLMYVAVAWLATAGKGRAIAILYTSVVMFCALLIHLLYPSNRSIPDWATPARLSEFQRPSGVSNDDLVLFIAGTPAPGLAGGPYLYSGNVHLLAGIRAINGYSPIKPRYLDGTYCFSVFGTPCNAVSGALVNVLEEFGLTTAELSGVNRVVVRNSRQAVIAAINGSGRFRECARNEIATTYCSLRNPSTPRPVTWISPWLTVQRAQAGRGHTVIDLSNRSALPGALFLSAPWRPGYVARYSGGSGRDVVIDLSPHESGALTIPVPARFIGKIDVFRQMPKGSVVFTISAIGLGLLLASATWITWLRRNQRSHH